jgi:hypothetical protein
MPDEFPIQPQQKRVADRVENGNLLVYHGLGSGKSRTAIEAAKRLGGPYTAVVPASLRENFRKEIGRWGDPAQPAEVLSQTAVGMGRVPEQDPNTLIIDEAQRLRNPESQMARQVMRMADHAHRTVLLSGTPIVNSPGDLAVPLSILTGSDPDPKAFEKRYVTREPVSRGLTGWLLGAPKVTRPAIAHRGELKRMLTGHVDYHPPMTPEGVTRRDERVEVELSQDQQRIHRLLWNELPMLQRWKLQNNYPLSKSDVNGLRAFFTGQRQAALSTLPFMGSPDPETAYSRSAKLQEADRRLTETLKDPRAKAIVFSNFIDAGLKPYSTHLTGQGIPNAIFHGGLTDAQRRQAVNDYNAGKLRALLLGPSGGEGISTKGTNLIQILDPHFNEARSRQAAGRGLRFDSHDGLPEDLKNVQVEHYVGRMPEPGFFGRLLGHKRRPTADELVEHMAERKQRVNDQFLDLLKEVGSKEAATSTIHKLREAKRMSDAGDYAGKQNILRDLVSIVPHEFHIDSRRGRFVGLTHRRSGFKIHTPAETLAGITLTPATPKPLRELQHAPDASLHSEV